MFKLIKKITSMLLIIFMLFASVCIEPVDAVFVVDDILIGSGMVSFVGSLFASMGVSFSSQTHLESATITMARQNVSLFSKVADLYQKGYEKEKEKFEAGLGVVEIAVPILLELLNTYVNPFKNYFKPDAATSIGGVLNTSNSSFQVLYAGGLPLLTNKPVIHEYLSPVDAYSRFGELKSIYFSYLPYLFKSVEVLGVRYWVERGEDGKSYFCSSSGMRQSMVFYLGDNVIYYDDGILLTYENSRVYVQALHFGFYDQTSTAGNYYLRLTGYGAQYLGTSSVLSDWYNPSFSANVASENAFQDVEGFTTTISSISDVAGIPLTSDSAVGVRVLDPPLDLTLEDVIVPGGVVPTIPDVSDVFPDLVDSLEALKNSVVNEPSYAGVYTRLDELERLIGYIPDLTAEDIVRLLGSLEDVNTGVQTGIDTGVLTNAGVLENVVAQEISRLMEQYNVSDIPSSNTSTGTINWAKLGTIAVFDKFPFSLPNDVYLFFDALCVPPKEPRFEFNLLGNIVSADTTVVLDFKEFEGVVKVFRNCLLVLFIAGLFYMTKAYIWTGGG